MFDIILKNIIKIILVIIWTFGRKYSGRILAVELHVYDF